MGCKFIVHAINSVQKDSNINPKGKWTLLLHFSNAFNSISCGKMLWEVRAHIPSMVAWLECCYGTHPLFHLRDCTILSHCGVQQGYPLGSPTFALALHPIVERIQCKISGLQINAWYLDDGTLCGTADDLRATLAIVEKDGPGKGLRLNPGKSLLYIPQDASFVVNPLPAEIPTVRSGFDLLESRIGQCSQCEATILNWVKKVQEILERYPDIQNAQMETTILRLCLALPSLVCSPFMATSPYQRCHLCLR